MSKLLIPLKLPFLAVRELLIRYLCGKKRAEFFLKHPPAKIIVIPNKIDFHGMGNPMIEFAWYVWDKGAEGTKIYWAEWK